MSISRKAEAKPVLRNNLPPDSINGIFITGLKERKFSTLTADKEGRLTQSRESPGIDG